MWGYIYKIEDNETKEYYIGSSTQTIARRIDNHITNDNKCRAYEIVRRNNFTFSILEVVNGTKTDLLIVEQKYMDENKSDKLVNKKVAFTGIKHKQCKEYFKEYYKNNKDKYTDNKIRRERSAYSRTWGELNNSLIDIKMDVFK